jgi:hypothetical protein
LTRRTAPFGTFSPVGADKAPMSDHSDLQPWLTGDPSTEALRSFPDHPLAFLRLGRPRILKMIERQIRPASMKLG